VLPSATSRLSAVASRSRVVLWTVAVEACFYALLHPAARPSFTSAGRPGGVDLLAGAHPAVLEVVDGSRVRAFERPHPSLGLPLVGERLDEPVAGRVPSVSLPPKLPSERCASTGHQCLRLRTLPRLRPLARGSTFRPMTASEFSPLPRYRGGLSPLAHLGTRPEDVYTSFSGISPWSSPRRCRPSCSMMRASLAMVKREGAAMARLIGAHRTSGEMAAHPRV